MSIEIEDETHEDGRGELYFAIAAGVTAAETFTRLSASDSVVTFTGFSEVLAAAIRRLTVASGV